MFEYYMSTFNLYRYEGGLKNVDMNYLYQFRLELMFFVYCCVSLCIVVYCCVLLYSVVYCSAWSQLKLRLWTKDEH